jgi:ComF family protein
MVDHPLPVAPAYQPPSAKPWREALAPALDFLLPHLCAHCRRPIGREPGVCAACWAQLSFITTPQCHCCGLPFPYDLGPEALCVECLERPPSFTLARAALRYDDAAKPLLLGFKHADKIHWRGLLTKMLLPQAAPILAGAAGMIPVPLHWSRLLRRKYNQAALIAQELSALAAIPHRPELLRRDKRTTPHVAMNRKQRQKNVTGAFSVPEKFHTDVAGKTWVLIDDVYTTGSTVDACSKALLAAGASEIRVLCLARVCHDI